MTAVAAATAALTHTHGCTCEQSHQGHPCYKQGDRRLRRRLDAGGDLAHYLPGLAALLGALHYQDASCPLTVQATHDGSRTSHLNRTNTQLVEGPLTPSPVTGPVAEASWIGTGLAGPSEMDRHEPAASSVTSETRQDSSDVAGAVHTEVVGLSATASRLLYVNTSATPDRRGEELCRRKA